MIKKMLYINTNLENTEGAIYYSSIDLTAINDNMFHYVVTININGRYNLEFKDKCNAMRFIEDNIQVNGNNGISFNDKTISLVKRDSDHKILINCYLNKELAIKLVKHFRKQYIKNREQFKRQQLKAQKQQLKQGGNPKQELQQRLKEEIDGIKF